MGTFSIGSQATVAAIEANNGMYCLQNRIKSSRWCNTLGTSVEFCRVPFRECRSKLFSDLSCLGLFSIVQGCLVSVKHLNNFRDWLSQSV